MSLLLFLGWTGGVAEGVVVFAITYNAFTKSWVLSAGAAGCTAAVAFVALAITNSAFTRSLWESGKVASDTVLVGVVLVALAITYKTFYRSVALDASFLADGT
jgi:hypothetical protein